MEVYIYSFNPFDIVGIFGRQCLLRLGGGIVSQGHDEIFEVNFSLTSADAPPTIRAWLSNRVMVLLFNAIAATGQRHAGP